MHYISSIISGQGIGVNGWYQIAKEMNVYLFSRKFARIEFFFDGSDCKRFFECNFSSLSSSKESVQLFSLDVELWPYIKQVQLACGDESSV